jgi:hypothetical protein
LARLPIRDSDVYGAIVSRFVEGRSWEDTEYYSRFTAEIERGETRWGCRTTDEFRDRLKALEDLFRAISEHGYRSQRELAAAGSTICDWDRESPFRLHNEVTVCIGRSGELLLRDDRHRHAIASILRIARIPVAVGLRHRYWHQFRQDVLAHAARFGGRVEYPLTHPDLRDIPSLYDDSASRLLLEHLRLRGVRGTVLDLEAQWGHFSHTL